MFLKENGEILGNLRELDDDLPCVKHKATNLKYSRSFTETTFIRAPGVPDLKINGIDYSYDITEFSEEHSVSADEVLLGILTDDAGEREYSFFSDYSVKAAHEVL